MVTSSAMRLQVLGSVKVGKRTDRLIQTQGRSNLWQSDGQSDMSVEAWRYRRAMFVTVLGVFVRSCLSFLN